MHEFKITPFGNADKFGVIVEIYSNGRNYGFETVFSYSYVKSITEKEFEQILRFRLKEMEEDAKRKGFVGYPIITEETRSKFIQFFKMHLKNGVENG